MSSKAKIPIIIYLCLALAFIAGCAGGVELGVTAGNSNMVESAIVNTSDNISDNIADSGHTGYTGMESPYPDKFPYKVYFKSEDADEIITQEYSLSDLTDYFGTDYYSEGGYFTYIFLHGNNPDIFKVNEKFKIECTRKSSSIFYTIYKVKEGGRYYIEWLPSSDGSFGAYCGVYINDLRNIEDFSSLQEGISTYDDVIKIDPSTEPYIDCTNDSFSLLDDGKILYIEYSFTGEGAVDPYIFTGKLKGENLLIESIQISGSRGAFLSYIYKYDLEF